MHICISKLTILGPNNGLSPGRRHAIIWTNAGILLICTLATNFSDIFSKINTVSSRKCISKCRLEKGAILSWPQCTCIKNALYLVTCCIHQPLQLFLSRWSYGLNYLSFWCNHLRVRGHDLGWPLTWPLTWFHRALIRSWRIPSSFLRNLRSPSTSLWALIWFLRQRSLACCAWRCLLFPRAHWSSWWRLGLCLRLFLLLPFWYQLLDHNRWRRSNRWFISELMEIWCLLIPDGLDGFNEAAVV